MKLLPAGARIGLFRRSLEIALRAALIAAGFLIFLYGAARILLLYEARRADAILTELNAIQLGTPETAIQSFLAKYERRDWEQMLGTRNKKIVVVDPWGLRGPSRPQWLADLEYKILDLAPNVRRKLGLRVWEAFGTIKIKDGKVVSSGSSVLVEGENEWLSGQSSLIDSNNELDHYRRMGTYRPGMERYAAGWTHLHMGMETGEALWNLLTPNATPEERKAAQSYNLACLTSMKGCHSLCELMPDAARYRKEHNYPALGHNSGSWNVQDDSCE